MNSILEQKREIIESVCIHELGHYILSKEMVFETTGICVRFEKNGSHSGYSGLKSWNPFMDSLSKMKVFLEKRVKVLYAGVIAECTDTDGNYNHEKAYIEWTIGGGRNDFSNIRELVRLIRDIEYPNITSEVEVNAQLKEIDEHLINETGKIVIERIDLIHNLAKTLSCKVNNFSADYILTENELNGIKLISELYN